MSTATKRHLVVFSAMFVGGLVLGFMYPPRRIAAMVWRAVLEAIPFLATWGVLP